MKLPRFPLTEIIAAIRKDEAQGHISPSALSLSPTHPHTSHTLRPTKTQPFSSWHVPLCIYRGDVLSKW